MFAVSLLICAIGATQIDVSVKLMLDGQTFQGSGFVIDSSNGRTSLFAEVQRENGVLGMVEIIRDGSETSFFYRELFQSRLIFRAEEIREGEANLPAAAGDWSLGGTFAFIALEGQRARVIEHGIIIKKRPLEPTEPTRPPVVIVDDHHHHYYDDGGCGGTTDSPDEPEYESSGGCEGDTVDDPDEPEYESSGGCEGDTVDDGSDDFETMDSGGGCEGDSADESAGGCEGDGVETDSSDEWTSMDSSMMMQGLFRLGWPIAVVGWFNRRVRKRSELASRR
jgi:hypothetical protein